MKSILFVALTMLLFTVMSCSSTRPGNRMISFDNDNKPGRYRGERNTANTITAILKDDASNRPIADALVELYDDDNMVNLVTKVVTAARGKFTFNVKDGIYTIVINHQKFKEEKFIVPVKGGDIDLNEIRLSRLFD